MRRQAERQEEGRKRYVHRVNTSMSVRAPHRDNLNEATSSEAGRECQVKIGNPKVTSDETGNEDEACFDFQPQVPRLFWKVCLHNFGIDCRRCTNTTVDNKK